jgi:hypothetical protein
MTCGRIDRNGAIGTERAYLKLAVTGSTAI